MLSGQALRGEKLNNFVGHYFSKQSIGFNANANAPQISWTWR